MDSWCRNTAQPRLDGDLTLFHPCEGGAPVAMQVSWDELGGRKAANVFTIANAPQRVRDLPDPWPDMRAQSLGKKLLAGYA